MPTIDADAHVVETEHTWEYMEPGDYKYRPQLATPKGESGKQYWVVSGKIRGLQRPVITAQAYAEISQRAGRNMQTPLDARDMENVEARIRHMDELGIDIQVLHSTMFIERIADTPEEEVPICKAYNRWLADIWREGKGRLRWTCTLPLLDMPTALKELRFAKEHGACGIFMRPVEGERLLHDPYFFPLYEEATRLDMAIAMHIANSNRGMNELLSQYLDFGAFWRLRLACVGAFHAWIVAGMPQRFPKLRFASIEASAQWVPYVVRDLQRRFAAQGQRLPDNPLHAFNMYVTCQTNDDVPYVLKEAGEDSIVIGTDYGHTDTSAEVEALRTLKDSGGVTAGQYQKITYDNPKALYAL